MTTAATVPAQSKRVLITGGTSGIGLAAARRLLPAASGVVINGRSEARGTAAIATLGSHKSKANVHFVAADVSTPEGAAFLIERTTEALGAPIDVLVNCAGGDFAPMLFHECALDTIDGVIRRWLLSTVYVCRLALPHLAAGAAIINVASDAAKVPTPGESVIGAAMAGIVMFSRTLAMEAKRRRIRVNALTPSLVRNTLTHDLVTAHGFSAKLFAKAVDAASLGVPEPDDVAAMIAFLASDEASKVTGQAVSVNGGISVG